jgi:hypothetical protein
MKKFHWMPVLGPRPAFISYHLMSLSNRRFKAIALTRRAAGEDGARNNDRRIKAYYNLNIAPFHMVARGLKLWAWAELDNVRLQVKRLFRRSSDSTVLGPRSSVTEARGPRPEA